MEVPPNTVEFTITDEDVDALRHLRPRRMRLPVLEWTVHLFAAMLAAILVAIAIAQHRTNRLPAYLGILLTIWIAAWGYLAFMLFRLSPEQRAWWEKLRQSRVLSRGRCHVSVDDHALTLITPTATQSFLPNQLEDCVHDPERLFVRTVQGDVLIIPRQAFRSHDEWADFVCRVRTRAHEDEKKGT